MSKIVHQSFPFFVTDLMNLKKIALCLARESYIFFCIFLMVLTSKVALPFNFLCLFLLMAMEAVLWGDPKTWNGGRAESCPKS